MNGVMIHFAELGQANPEATLSRKQDLMLDPYNVLYWIFQSFSIMQKKSTYDAPSKKFAYMYFFATEQPRTNFFFPMWVNRPLQTSLSYTYL